jgi:gliding motility-associated-like protein
MQDGSIIPTPAGGTGAGYEYIWSNGVYQRFNTDIAAGSYVLTLNDANNCTITDTINLTDPDTLEITSIDVTDVSCLGRTDGSAGINVSGGTGALEFSPDNGATFVNQSPIVNLNAGDYTIVVRDEKDCLSESQAITITISDTVTIDSIRVVDATCAGLNNGSVSLVAEGGAGPYEYSNDGGTTFENTGGFASLAAGDYHMMVRDNNDCRSEEMPVTIINTDTIRITELVSTDLTCSGTPDGTITITASGGTGEYTYSTDGGDNFGSDSAIISLAQGDYMVVVKDGNDCLSEEDNVTLHTTDVCAMVIFDAFSPNDDGKNDVWNIQNAGSFPNIIVKIFNLWGKEVFSSKGYGTPWDGTWDGKDLPSGTYYYVIDPGDGSDVITGDVSIVK